jgi:UDP-N-acetylglucosamine 2-epimerase (non-hydrolysing)
MTRAGQIGSAIRALDELFSSDPPSAVVVQGDTNTTMAGAVAANAHEIPIVHVEAGLRSHDRQMPEEHNRVVTDHLADLLCAPTDVARGNAVAEGIEPSRIKVTGNTVVEAVQRLMPSAAQRHSLVAGHGLESGRFVLSTFHRPENVDDPDRFELIIKQLGELELPVLLPLHPRSKMRAETHGLARRLREIEVVEPIGYREFLGLGAESAYLISDSGGVQEEVSVYKRPVIVVRRSTERPEVLGTFARLVAADGISAAVEDWLADPQEVHAQLAELESPYGDGSASDRTVHEIGRLLADA